jgi:hypothetical protein
MLVVVPKKPSSDSDCNGTDPPRWTQTTSTTPPSHSLIAATLCSPHREPSPSACALLWRRTTEGSAFLLDRCTNQFGDCRPQAGFRAATSSNNEPDSSAASVAHRVPAEGRLPTARRRAVPVPRIVQLLLGRMAHCRAFHLVQYDTGRHVRNRGLEFRQAPYQTRHTNRVRCTYGKHNVSHFQAAQGGGIPTRSQGVEAKLFI